ncbi:hypothetical protein HIM_11358 [Hirsutella minnesotensis 3608]|uniref:Polyketide synthase n=1 Tax=Hirsutella minnesotensis 3608 TaxID=1043627 RepID=A0A0F7ZJ42_9HYPO|nr:hypothetical protein HIM_11358 [Hirsutella minnesotensis 3608]
MANQVKLYLFGDQTYDIQPNLKTLLLSKSNPVLDAFLSKALDAIQLEIDALRHALPHNVPRFTTVYELVLWNQTTEKRCIALDMAVTCLYHLATFMASQADVWTQGTQRAQVAGICTGSLAAAAVSCSRDLLHLVPMAVDAVTVAFRVGARVADVADRVGPAQDAGERWALAVAGPSSFEAVDKFLQDSLLPLTGRPYVSAYAPNGITVSGPPRVLAELAESSVLKGVRSAAVPVYGPYHASHLYTQRDITDVIGDLASTTASGTENLPFLSGDQTVAHGRTFVQLLENAARQIFLDPIRWSNLLGNLQASLKDAESFSITPIGTTADQLIYTALKQTPLRTMLPSTPSSRQPAVPETVTSNADNGKIAIIGMSGRFPDSKDNDAFWQILSQGLDVHKRVPALRWDTNTHVDPSGRQKNASAAQFGNWLDDPARFDARFFNIAPRAAPQIDPAQRLALMTAYEAIEQAGVVPDSTPSTKSDRIGVIYGITGNDWMETNSAQDVDTYFIPGGNRAFIPGRVSYYFKFGGPSYALDTACSSSMASIQLACSMLHKKEIDMAVAGGTNIITNPDLTAGYDRGHFLSHTGNCKPFDDGADGYCRGEGVGTIVVKRLEDAIADHDPILGVILGTETNHSVESDSITRPDPGAQVNLFHKILRQAAVEPNSIDYVEMHGTGTQAGDAGEMSSVLETFAPPVSIPGSVARKSNQALYLGSAKANIGHGEAASGIASLIKVLLMMENNTIVPHIGIKTKINSKFPSDLHERNVHIARESTPWPPSDASKPRRAFVNNFSAAGGNTALLLEDAPVSDQGSEPTLADPRSQHLVACSAKTAASLRGNLTSLLEFLEKNPEVNLGQLSYTTTARRIHYPNRVMLSGSVEQICTQIETALRDNMMAASSKRTAPKLVFTFTGQGAQYAGMGKQLFATSSVFRTEMLRLDQTAQSLGFPSVLSVVEADAQQDIRDFSPVVVQLASICMQISLCRLWASLNVTPTAVVGHSLGEYAALNTAGVLSDADTLYLVGKRAEILENKCARGTHAMLVARASAQEVASGLGDAKHEIACLNSATETVLAGPNEDISAAKSVLSGFKCTQLAVPYAFHSSQVDPVLQDFKRVASGVTYGKARIPILCPLTGELVPEGSCIFGPDYLARHAREPVNMLKALQNMPSNVATLEVGPHPAVSGMVKAVLGPQVQTLFSSQRTKPAWDVVAATLKSLYTAGADIRWAEYHRDFPSSQQVLRLPAYSWDLKEYWIRYRNDWSLRKGEALPAASMSAGLRSATIHRVIEETSTPDSINIDVETDIARSDLASLVQGHTIDGMPLFSPSVYTDIALNIGKFILQTYYPNQSDKGLDVSCMSLSKPLVLHANTTEQLLETHVEVNRASQIATIKYLSANAQKKSQEYASCTLRFKDTRVPASLHDEIRAVLQRKRTLVDGVASKSSARFNHSMLYRYMRPLEWFHRDYRALDEIVLDSNTLEASSRLSLGGLKAQGDFHLHPAVTDALAQTCVFAMNCNDNADLDTDTQVYVNHGWSSFQMFEPLDPRKVYSTYTRMVEGTNQLWHGDLFVFDGDKLVALFTNMAIQGVARRVLRSVLTLETSLGATKQQDVQKQHVSTQKAVAAPRIANKLAQVGPPPAQSWPSKAAFSDRAGDKTSQTLSIIAQVSGVAMDDIGDDVLFSDLGIDSLLAIAIKARLSEELNVHLGSDMLIGDESTVGDLKAMLGDLKAMLGDSKDSGSSTPSPSDSASDSGDSSGSGAMTPGSEVNSDDPVECDIGRVLEIFSQESGVATHDMTNDLNFADSGIDSLVFHSVVGRLRLELQLDVKHSALYSECFTVGELKEFMLNVPSLTPN